MAESKRRKGAQPDHTHTPHCRGMSRFALVQVRAVVERGGRASVSVSMKPEAECWSELLPAYRVRLEGMAIPRSPEEAAEVAIMAIREAFPGLF